MKYPIGIQNFEKMRLGGRADVVLQTPDYVYILELKLDGSPAEALQQINAKGYARPFAADTRKLYKLGINFSSETREIAGWEMEE